MGAWFAHVDRKPPDSRRRMDRTEWSELLQSVCEAERAQKLAELRKGPKPEPLPIDRTAAEMTPAQRDAWLKEHVRRFG